MDYDFRGCSSKNIGEYFSGGRNVTTRYLYPDFSKGEFPLVKNRHEIDYIMQECLIKNNESLLSRSELLQIVNNEIEMVRIGPRRYKYSNESLPRLESIKHIVETEYR